MIELHRLQKQMVVINADLIEFVESTPDTMICTTTGKRILVLETVDEVVEKVVQYKRRISILKTRRA